MRRTKRGGWPYSQPPNTPFEINRASPQAKGLMAWWPALAAPGAKVLRELVSGNDCSFVGSPVWFNTPQMGMGVGGDAAGDRFLLTNPVVLAQGTPWTIAIWVRYDAAVNLPGLYGYDFSVGKYGRALFSVSNEILSVRNDINDKFEPAFILVDQEVYHIVIADDGSDAGNNVTVYVNGVSLGAGEVIGANTTITTIGDYDDDGAVAWRGPFFDFRIYDTAKSTSEDSQMFANPWELYKPLVRRWVGWRSPAPPPVGGHMTLWGRYWGP